MLAELILSYALVSDVPLYVREAAEPYNAFSVELRVQGGELIYYRLSPYLYGYSEDLVGVVGAEVELGWSSPVGRIGWHHRSEHNVDRDGIYLRIDSIVWAIPLN